VMTFSGNGGKDAAAKEAAERPEKKLNTLMMLKCTCED
jgi:hypothetical protein